MKVGKGLMWGCKEPWCFLRQIEMGRALTGCFLIYLFIEEITCSLFFLVLS
jgi:hypothetical protein